MPKRKAKPKKRPATQNVGDNSIIALNSSLTSLRFFKGDVEVERIYWRLRSRNGRIVADGAEGYESLAMAKKGFCAAAKLAAKALVEMGLRDGAKAKGR